MSGHVAPIEHASQGGVRPEVDWLTCLDDQLDHAVAISSDADTIDRDAAAEQYAICGTLFVTAPPACIPRPPCPHCAMFVRAGGSSRGAPKRPSPVQTAQQTHRGWLRQLRIRLLARAALVTLGWKAAL